LAPTVLWCLEKLATEGPSGEVEVALAAMAITTHLLALLMTFVGEAITLRLVREAWPQASFESEN